jgi:predicted aldo/keto reductase-like oxidoreductase
VDNYAWDFVMIQLNYLDWDRPAETISPNERSKIAGSLYRMLAEKNIPCFVMEPVKGGQLAALTPPAVKILKKAEPNRSTASWALRYAATLPNVVTVLSGMSDLSQVIDNINTMTAFKPLTQADYKVVTNAKLAFRKNQQIACTDCRYCMPCPYGVNIAGIFQVYNKCSGGLGIPDPDTSDAGEYQMQKRSFLAQYKNNIEKSARADHCIGCGTCLKLCPQNIPIPTKLQQIDVLVDKVKKSHGEEAI